MLRLVISGCGGHMGRALERLCRRDPQVEVAAGIDTLGGGGQEFPVYPSPAQLTGDARCVVDFSSPSALEGLLDLALNRGIPLVLATTGYTPEQERQVWAAARRVPIFRSANMSLGIGVLLELVKQAARSLGDGWDIEVLERHHRWKVDAPSGTALILAHGAASARNYEENHLYSRNNLRRPRDQGEIGISSLRGGTIPGEHLVVFAGQDEVIELKHTALSRDIYAQGALEAAKFISSVERPGLYDMGGLVSWEKPPRQGDTR